MLDNLNKFEADVFLSEKRAFFHERAFQVATGSDVDFEKIEDLLEFVYRVYKKEIK